MVTDWLTVEIAERVEELRRNEYSYRRVFETIKDEYPSLKIKDYPGIPHILAREAAWLLQNHRANTHNED